MLSGRLQEFKIINKDGISRAVFIAGFVAAFIGCAAHSPTIDLVTARLIDIAT